MPRQIFNASAMANARAKEVWARLQIPETWEGITGVDSVFDAQHDEAGRLTGFKFHSTVVGNRYVGTASPGPRDEERSLTWDIRTPEISGRVSVELSPADDSTSVEVMMKVEPVSTVAILAFPLIVGAIGNGFQQTVDDFAEDLGR